MLRDQRRLAHGVFSGRKYLNTQISLSSRYHVSRSEVLWIHNSIYVSFTIPCITNGSSRLHLCIFNPIVTRYDLPIIQAWLVMSKQSTILKSTGRTIRRNLQKALEVAGKSTDKSGPRRLPAATIQRETGIARSTLRGITVADPQKIPNPDTKTLALIAKQLGIPTGLLLLSGRDWQAILSAFESFPDMFKAAEILRKSGQAVSEPTTVLEILRTARVYSAHPNRTDDAEINARIAFEHAQLSEITRRKAYVLGALLKSAAASADGDLMYTKVMAFAAALAGQNFTQQDAPTEGTVDGQRI